MEEGRNEKWPFDFISILKKSDSFLVDEVLAAVPAIPFNLGNDSTFKVFIAQTHSLPRMVVYLGRFSRCLQERNTPASDSLTFPSCRASDVHIASTSHCAVHPCLFDYQGESSDSLA